MKFYLILQDFDSVLVEMDVNCDYFFGILCFIVFEMVLMLFVQKIIFEFLNCYFEMCVDFVVELVFVDIVVEGFDVGFWFGEVVFQDMVVVYFGGLF